MAITVLVADDAIVMRRAIKRILEHNAEVEIVGEAEDFRQIIEKAAELKPQVILMDLQMSNRAGLKMSEARNLLAGSASRLLAMSFAIDEESEKLAAKLGAERFLDKMKLFGEIIPAIKRLGAPAKPSV